MTKPIPPGEKQPPKAGAGRNATGQFTKGNSAEWEKGCPSPNPAGRPKRKTLTEMLLTKLDEPCPSDKHGRTWGEMIIISTVAHGVKGQTISLKEVWDRADGKVKQNVEVSGGLDIGNLDAKRKLADKLTDQAKREGKKSNP